MSAETDAIKARLRDRLCPGPCTCPDKSCDDERALLAEIERLEEAYKREKRNAECYASELPDPDTDVENTHLAHAQREVARLTAEVERLEAARREREEAYAALQVRCFEGFPSATDGIFDHCARLTAEVERLKEHLEIEREIVATGERVGRRISERAEQAEAALAAANAEVHGENEKFRKADEALAYANERAEKLADALEAHAPNHPLVTAALRPAAPPEWHIYKPPPPEAKPLPLGHEFVDDGSGICASALGDHKCGLVEPAHYRAEA